MDRRNPARRRGRRLLEGLAAIEGHKEGDLRVAERGDVDRAIGGHVDLRIDGAGQDRGARGGRAGADPSRAVILRARESHAAVEVPHGVDVAVVGARRVRVSRRPLLVVAGIVVNGLRRAPGLTAVRRFVDHHPDRLEHGWRRAEGAGESDDIDVADVVPGKRRIRHDSEAGHGERRRIMPGLPAILRVRGRKREVIGLYICEFFGRADNLKRIVRVDCEVRFAARVVETVVVGDLNVAHGRPPFSKEKRTPTKSGATINSLSRLRRTPRRSGRAPVRPMRASAATPQSLIRKKSG